MIQDLREELEIIKSSDLDYDSFQNCFENELDKHASMKKKYARANDGPFTNRALGKAFVLRTRLENKYNKRRTVQNWEAFGKQRKLCVKLFRTEKKELLQEFRYFQNNGQ